MENSADNQGRGQGGNASGWKGHLSLALIFVFYILCNSRYSPGRPAASLAATMMQILATAPFVIGISILLVYFLQRLSGQRLLWDRILRIYLTFGIIIGFLVNLYDYFSRA